MGEKDAYLGEEEEPEESPFHGPSASVAKEFEGMIAKNVQIQATNSLLSK